MKTAWWKATMMVVAVLLLVGCGDDKTTSPSGKTGTAQEADVPGAPVGVNHRGVDDGDMLRWNAPSANDVDVAGYNVYLYEPDPNRMDSYLQVNTELITDGRIVLDDLVAGQTYHFRVTAVSVDDVESPPSDPRELVATGHDDTGSAGGGRGGLGESELDPVDPGDDDTIQY